jgi:hypothetical protein
MDAEGRSEPMTHLDLRAASRAEENGYLALNDIAKLSALIGIEYRIVGGQMVTLHVAKAGVDEPVIRVTLDADLGVEAGTAGDPALVASLESMGYDRPDAANRFIRLTDDRRELVIDLLAPSYGTKMLTNRQHGDMTLDEIPGLSLALARSGEALDLTVHFLDGGSIDFTTIVPDLFAALCLKLLAWGDRGAAKDAHDVWRLLRAFRASLPEPPAFGEKGIQLDAARVLRQDFALPSGRGSQLASSYRDEQAEIRALALEALKNTSA